MEEKKEQNVISKPWKIFLIPLDIDIECSEFVVENIGSDPFTFVEPIKKMIVYNDRGVTKFLLSPENSEERNQRVNSIFSNVVLDLKGDVFIMTNKSPLSSSKNKSEKKEDDEQKGRKKRKEKQQEEDSDLPKRKKGRRKTTKEDEP